MRRWIGKRRTITDSDHAPPASGRSAEAPQGGDGVLFKTLRSPA